MLMTLCITVAIVALLVVLAPFIFGEGGALGPSASINSIEKLVHIKNSILERFLADEEAHKQQNLSDSEWNRRRHFLINRYVDTIRRIDYLGQQEGEP